LYAPVDSRAPIICLLKAIEAIPVRVGASRLPPMTRHLQTLLLLFSLCGIALGLWQRDRLPAPSRLVSAIAQEPLQTPTRLAGFKATAAGVEYTIKPLFDYRIQGVVVSRHDSAAWWDLVHRKDWNDHLNVADLCIVWGTNATSGIYRELRYWSEVFTCNVATDSNAVWQRFNEEGLSNNHLLTNEPTIARLLRNVRPGDQVEITGRLSEYSHNAGLPFKRGTSIRRDDHGDGACETIWVDTARVLREANRGWRTVLNLAWLGLALSVLWWFVLPPKSFNR